MLHYNPRHVSSINMPIFRRTNCIINIEICNSEKAEQVYQYKNTKIKLHKNNAAICYNKTCRARQITPTYANIKLKGTNSRCQRAKDAAIRFRINQEIKF